jgi:hypothetical protein
MDYRDKVIFRLESRDDLSEREAMELAKARSLTIFSCSYAGSKLNQIETEALNSLYERDRPREMANIIERFVDFYSEKGIPSFLEKIEIFGRNREYHYGDDPSIAFKSEEQFEHMLAQALFNEIPAEPLFHKKLGSRGPRSCRQATTGSTKSQPVVE